MPVMTKPSVVDAHDWQSSWRKTEVYGTVRFVFRIRMRNVFPASSRREISSSCGTRCALRPSSSRSSALR